MGKVAKLHRRLVKKRNELKLHRRAVLIMWNVLQQYADHRNWVATDETKDVMEKGIVIGVERLMAWKGPGVGPGLAQSFIDSQVVSKKKEVKKHEDIQH